MRITNEMEEEWSSSETLIHRLDDGQLEIVQSTLDHLNGMQNPVQVVAIVGPFRTGKSYLLNHIIHHLTGKENVFAVGDTVRALTRGINIWCCPHPSCEGLSLIFLDTEGLNDVEKGDKGNDILIFVLAILLSSSLVYNSCGVIDFQALQTIHHVSYLADRIRVMSDVCDDVEDFGFDLAFPEFLWVIKDFQLKLEQDGRKITDDDYLEEALSTSRPGWSPKDAALNSIRRCIKDYFPKRKCFALPNFKNVEAVPTAPGSRYAALVDQILSGDCKMHQGSEVTGRVFGKLARELVAAIQNPTKPIDVQSIMNRISNEENSIAVKQGFDKYQLLMKAKTIDAVEEVTLHRIHLNCSEDATKSFLQNAVYPVDRHCIELMDLIKEEFEKINEKNSNKIQEVCDQTFKTLHSEIIGNIAPKYICSGGFHQYRKDMTELRKRWEEIPILQGAVGRNCFLERLKKLKEEEADMIMNADREMTALKKEEAARRHENERQRLEEKRKHSEENCKAAILKDQKIFEENVSGPVRSAILRPHETEISKLNLRILVLERELDELQKKKTTCEEADSCQHRLNLYSQMLHKKQDGLSRWHNVSTSIRSFATEVRNSICKFFKSPEVTNVVVTATAAAAAAVTSSAPSSASILSAAHALKATIPMRLNPKEDSPTDSENQNSDEDGMKKFRV